MAATRKDVARLAQVSETTVSYVINNKKNITPEVRERVQKAVEELNYRPSILAQSLATRETRHVAMLVDNTLNPHYGNIMAGAQHAAEAEGYIVSILSANYSAKEAMEELVSRGIDGVILALPTATIRAFSDVELPMAYEDENLRTDYRQAIFDMVQAFHSLGHQRVAFLSGLPLNVDNLRYRHFQKALAYFGMDTDPALFIDGNGATDEKAGYDAAGQLLASGVPFTGIFALNDLMAIGAMRRLWEAGIHIPEDVSLVGCDGINMTEYTLPPLSTIQTYSFSLGEGLMRRLITKIHPDRGLPPGDSIIQAEFIQRESIGASRKRR